MASMLLCGGHSIVNGMILCLYRLDDALYFRLGEDEFKIADDATSILVHEDGYRLFQLSAEWKRVKQLQIPFPHL